MIRSVYVCVRPGFCQFVCVQGQDSAHRVGACGRLEDKDSCIRVEKKKKCQGNLALLRMT